MAGLAFEFLVVFFGPPTLFRYARHRIPAPPALWGVAVYCLYVLLGDPHFDRARLWNQAPFAVPAPAILTMFAIAFVPGVLLLRRFAPPELLFQLPRVKPALWLLIMVLCPLLSVYPQGVIYRAFIFERYRALFGAQWAIVLASAIAFAYVHIVVRNRLAVVLTFFGGLIFAARYPSRDRSSSRASSTRFMAARCSRSAWGSGSITRPLAAPRYPIFERRASGSGPRVPIRRIPENPARSCSNWENAAAD